MLQYVQLRAISGVHYDVCNYNYIHTLQDINMLLTLICNYIQLYYYNCIRIITYYNYTHT